MSVMLTALTELTGPPAFGAMGVDIVDQFVRNEDAAAEAYRLVNGRLDDADAVCCRGLLRQLQEEHELAAEAFHQMCGMPQRMSPTDLGIWELAVSPADGLFQP